MNIYAISDLEFVASMVILGLFVFGVYGLAFKLVVCPKPESNGGE